MRLTTVALVPVAVLLSAVRDRARPAHPGRRLPGRRRRSPSALLLVFLAASTRRSSACGRSSSSSSPRPAAPARFVLIGIGGLIFAGALCRTSCPLGTAGALLSAGTIPLLNIAVGLRGRRRRSSLLLSRVPRADAGRAQRRAASASPSGASCAYVRRGLAPARRALGHRHEPQPDPPGRSACRSCSPRPTCCCSRSATARAARRPCSSTSRRRTPAVDPVVQALTLTDVVVGATVTALLLALAVQAHKRFGTLDPDELDPMRD